MQNTAKWWKPLQTLNWHKINNTYSEILSWSAGNKGAPWEDFQEINNELWRELTVDLCRLAGLNNPDHGWLIIKGGLINREGGGQVRVILEPIQPLLCEQCQWFRWYSTDFYIFILFLNNVKSCNKNKQKFSWMIIMLIIFMHPFALFRNEV